MFVNVSNTCTIPHGHGKLWIFTFSLCSEPKDIDFQAKLDSHWSKTGTPGFTHLFRPERRRDTDVAPVSVKQSV